MAYFTFDLLYTRHDDGCGGSCAWRSHGSANGHGAGGGLAGVTTAECVAVCCYFLCAVPEFVVLVALCMPTIVAEAKSKREGIH